MISKYPRLLGIYLLIGQIRADDPHDEYHIITAVKNLTLTNF
jgi:hypothetical protein